MVCGFRHFDPQRTCGTSHHSSLKAIADIIIGQGVSGSWVINGDNGDLYGIVVAEDSSDDNLIMLRARDVFDDIERVRGCSVTLPSPEETPDSE